MTVIEVSSPSKMAAVPVSELTGVGLIYRGHRRKRGYEWELALRLRRNESSLFTFYGDSSHKAPQSALDEYVRIKEAMGRL